MPIPRILLACAIVGLLALPTPGLAQYSNNSSAGPSYGGVQTGRQGMFGNRVMGAGPKSGRGGLGSGNALSSQADLSNARYVRGNRQPGDFVGGNDRAGDFVGGLPTDSYGNGSLSGWQMPSSTSGGYRNARWASPNQNQQDQYAPSAQNAVSIRTTYHPDFEYSKPDASRLSTSLTQRLAKLSAIEAVHPIRVEVQGQTAILQGVVSTEHDRLLAERLVRLEPAIAEVRNEVAVENQTSPE